MHTLATVDLLQEKWAHELGAVAAVAWMTWDTLINVADEVEYLWSGHASWVRWTYAFIRYAPIFHAGVVINHYGTSGNSASRCKAYIAWELVFLELLTIAVEVILVIRVLVLYNQSKILRTLIAVAFIAEVVAMIATISLVIKGQRYTDDCIGDASPKIFVGYWITVQVFEISLFGLTFAICFRRSWSGTEIGRKQPVFHLLLRDGTWVFALITVSTLLNLLLYQLNNTPRADDGYFWELAVLSYAGSHVILNTRQLRAPGFAVSHADVSYLWDYALNDNTQALPLDNITNAPNASHNGFQVAHIEFVRQQ